MTEASKACFLAGFGGGVLSFLGIEIVYMTAIATGARPGVWTFATPIAMICAAAHARRIRLRNAA